VDVPLIAWVGLVAGFVALLLVDLFVLHRRDRVISIRDAGWSTAGFVGISVVFGLTLGLLQGSAIAGQFFAG
jgi:hypothetical protein